MALGVFVLRCVKDCSGARSYQDRLNRTAAYVRFTHTTTSVMMVNRGLGRNDTNKHCAFLSKNALLANARKKQEMLAVIYGIIYD